MILVVEGPSAAGKTTWCRQHTSAVVAEHTPTGGEPDGSDLLAQAAYPSRRPLAALGSPVGGRNAGRSAPACRQTFLRDTVWALSGLLS